MVWIYVPFVVVKKTAADPKMINDREVGAGVLKVNDLIVDIFQHFTAVSIRTMFKLNLHDYRIHNIFIYMWRETWRQRYNHLRTKNADERYYDK